jgi:hypothetical protein
VWNEQGDGTSESLGVLIMPDPRTCNRILCQGKIVSVRVISYIRNICQRVKLNRAWPAGAHACKIETVLEL